MVSLLSLLVVLEDQMDKYAVKQRKLSRIYDKKKSTLPKLGCLLSRPFWTFGELQRVHLLRVLLS